MMTTLFHNLLGSPVRELSLALESWPASVGALESEEMEETIQRCLKLPLQLKHLVKQQFFDAFEKIDDLDRVHVQLRTAFENAKALIRGVMGWTATLDREGVGGTHTEQLATALQKVAEMEDDLFRHWTLPTEEDVQQALAADARGETLDLTDAFASIKGMSRAAWLQHVEEYQRNRKP